MCHVVNVNQSQFIHSTSSVEKEKLNSSDKQDEQKEDLVKRKQTKDTK